VVEVLFHANRKQDVPTPTAINVSCVHVYSLLQLKAVEDQPYDCLMCPARRRQLGGCSASRVDIRLHGGKLSQVKLYIAHTAKESLRDAGGG
jgi:hypothetical protein